MALTTSLALAARAVHTAQPTLATSNNVAGFHTEASPLARRVVESAASIITLVQLLAVASLALDKNADIAYSSQL